MQLNEQQILFLEFLIEKKGIRHEMTQAELLDHLISNIEQKMEQSILFHDALDQAIAEFGADNFTIIQNQQDYFSRQNFKRRMKRAIIILLFILSGLLVVFAQPSLFQEQQEYVKMEEKEVIPPQEIFEAKLVNQEPPDAYPVLGDYPIVSSFGKRFHPVYKKAKFHKGIDIKAPTGTHVIATSDGIIIKAEQTDNYGMHIIIQHDKTYKSLYAHLSQMDVKVGEKVSKGQKIGEVGSTGRSTTPHLHYEVIKKGEKVNPEEYIQM